MELNRRASDNEEDAQLKKDMLEALSSIEDPGQKVVLMLLVRSMDNISQKLDRVLADEEKLKHIVLNGHAAKHDDHHKWIEVQSMKTEDISKAVDFTKTRIANNGYCDYAAKMIASDKVIADSKKKVAESILEKVIWGVLMLLLGVFSSKFLGITI